MTAHGLVQAYTGDGKGKSTAAMGLAVRAAGHGRRVTVVTFFKDPEALGGGEFSLLPRMGIEVHHFARKHPQLNPGVTRDEASAQCRSGLQFVMKLWAADCCDVLVLDEILVAARDGFLATEELVSLIAAKPEGMELVLTGRGMPDELLPVVDLVSEIRKVKHPFDSGVQGRKGMEY